jgi:hypothetical protein
MSDILIPDTNTATPMPSSDLRQKYRACDDPNRPACRDFVNQGKCHRRHHCKFYHPKVVTREITKRTKRDLGHCYCGATQKTIMVFKRNEDGMTQHFFRVCGRTGKSMTKCM